MQQNMSEEEDSHYVHSVLSVPFVRHCDPSMWTGFLPPPYGQDPKVQVYMVPADCKFRQYDATDDRFKGIKMIAAEFEHVNDDTGLMEEYRIPLQLAGQDFGNWTMQKKIIEEQMGGRMHPVAYSGLLSEIPPKCVMSLDFKPVLVLFSSPHEEMLDLRKYMFNLTKAADING